MLQTMHLAKSCEQFSTNNGGEKRKQFEVGIFRSYEEHVQCALQLPHPVESTEGVPDDLKRAAFNVVTKGMYEVARLRNEAMKDCLKMANDLKLEEKALHDRMNPSLAKITANKKILLFEETSARGELRGHERCILFERWSPIDRLGNGIKSFRQEMESTHHHG